MNRDRIRKVRLSADEDAALDILLEREGTDFSKWVRSMLSTTKSVATKRKSKEIVATKVQDISDNVATNVEKKESVATNRNICPFCNVNEVRNGFMCEECKKTNKMT